MQRAFFCRPPYVDSMNNYSWRIGISGSENDLKHLEQHFAKESEVGQVKWDEEGRKFVYASTSLDACTTAGEVLSIAEQKLLVLSGILKITRGSRQPLHASNAYKLHIDGARDYFMNIHEGAHAVDFCDATLSATGADGSTISEPPLPPRSFRLAQRALSDPVVAKVLRLVAGDDAQTWVGMYRIHEVIKDNVGGGHLMEERGWGGTTMYKRFKHSANSVSVGGDEARHGVELTEPPKDPMTSEEAVAFLNYVVEAWLASKGM